MKISRWILIPLECALLFGAWMALTNFDAPFQSFFFGFVSGAILGLILQTISYARIGRLFSNKSNRHETDFSVKQKRSVVVLLPFDKAFDLCGESVTSVANAKIKSADRAARTIKAKVGMNLHSWGTSVTFNLAQIGENLTEIEINARPVFHGTIVDYGESLKTIEKITELLKTKDAAINQKVLFKSAEILEDADINPFRKEKKTIRRN